MMIVSLIPEKPAATTNLEIGRLLLGYGGVRNPLDEGIFQFAITSIITVDIFIVRCALHKSKVSNLLRRVVPDDKLGSMHLRIASSTKLSRPLPRHQLL